MGDPAFHCLFPDHSWVTAGSYKITRPFAEFLLQTALVSENERYVASFGLFFFRGFYFNVQIAKLFGLHGGG